MQFVSGLSTLMCINIIYMSIQRVECYLYKIVNFVLAAAVKLYKLCKTYRHM